MGDVCVGDGVGAYRFTGSNDTELAYDSGHDLRAGGAVVCGWLAALEDRADGIWGGVWSIFTVLLGGRARGRRCEVNGSVWGVDGDVKLDSPRDFDGDSGGNCSGDHDFGEGPVAADMGEHTGIGREGPGDVGERRGAFPAAWNGDGGTGTVDGVGVRDSYGGVV